MDGFITLIIRFNHARLKHDSVIYIAEIVQLKILVLYPKSWQIWLPFSPHATSPRNGLNIIGR